MYQERASRVRGAVVWTAHHDVSDKRILPDGCMDLIWGGGSLVVAGPDTHAHVVSITAPGELVGIRFAPGNGPSIFGVGAWELLDQRTPLDEIWRPAEVRALTERLAASPDPGALLEAIAHQRIALSEGPPSMVETITALVGGGRRVATVADAVSLSIRQLQRRCTDLYGYGPKTLARILRMNSALDMIRAGAPYAATAVAAGYSDQAHMSREIKALAGATIGELIH